MYGPGGALLKVKGKFKTTINKNKISTEEEAYVMDGLHTPLVGGLDAMALKLIARLDSISMDSEDTAKCKFPNFFLEYTTGGRNDAQ